MTNLELMELRRRLEAPDSTKRNPFAFQLSVETWRPRYLAEPAVAPVETWKPRYLAEPAVAPIATPLRKKAPLPTDGHGAQLRAKASWV